MPDTTNPPSHRRQFMPRPAEGLNFASAVEMFMARVARTPELTALRHKKGPHWESLSWREWEAASRRVATALVHDLGIERGDRVALMATTRLEWVILDVAIAMAGAVSVPVYPRLHADEVSFILEDSECVVAFLERGELAAHLCSTVGTPRRGNLRDVVWLPGVDHEEIDGLTTHEYTELCANADPDLRSVRGDLEAVRDQLDLESVFTIVYTSGTTARPKGVVLTHKNIVYEAWAIKNTIAVDQTDEHLLSLPLDHVFARHMLWAAIESGAVTALGDLAKLEQQMREVAPTFVGGVPRVYEKIERRMRELAQDHGPVRRRAFAWCLDVGRKVSLARRKGQVVPTWLAVRKRAADRTLLDSLRTVFGGRLRFFISGAAPLPAESAEFFHALGILVLEGYGLTETTGATHVNRPDRFRFGTVGPALPGCEVLIADDGEVLLRGHNVMREYLGLPQATRDAIDQDGWFHTGDIGVLSDGFLRITGRKKDVIITASGKTVSPFKLETRLRACMGIDHVIVLGDRRPHLVALLALDEEAMMKVATREGLGCRTYRDLAGHPRIRSRVQNYVDELNTGLSRYERIRAFAILPAPLNDETGELTPTQKVRRDVVARRHQTLVEGLYGAA